MPSSSVYPLGIDSFRTDHVNEVNEIISADDVNQINDAIHKIETELGITPKGSYASVAAAISQALLSTQSFCIFVCSAYATVSEKNSVTAAGGYICDGVDDDVQINQAITDVKSRTPAQGAIGGIVQLLGPRFNTSNSIVMKSYVQLLGQGRFYTSIRSQSTWNGAANSGLVSSDDTGGITPTEYWHIGHLSIDGNKSNQTAVVTRGISDVVSTNVGFTYNDSSHSIEYVRIIDTLGDGWYYSGPNQRAGRFNNVRIERPDLYGLNTDAADSHFHNMDIGSAGYAGYYIRGATNHRFTNCKAYFCGRLQTVPTSTQAAIDGSGFKINGPRNSFAACEAQDCTGHGFTVGSNHNTLVGCIADSNSWRTANANSNSADGFNVQNDVHYVTILGWAIDKNETNRGFAMRNGVRVSSSTPLSSDLIINVAVDGALSGPLSLPAGILHSKITVVGSTLNARGTGTTTSGSNSVTSVTAAQGAFAIGQLIEGTGITSGTTITAFSGGTITLSANATASGTVTILGKTRSATGVRSGGTFTSTPGAVTTVSIAHNLGTAPNYFNASRGDANARGAPAYHLTADATNVILNFASALTAATAYTWVWIAEVLPT